MKIYTLLLFLALLGACSPPPKQKNLSKFLPSAKATNNIYQLNPQQDTVIHSDSGLVLFIAKNSFVDKNGEPIKEPIELNLNSYKKLAQMLGKGLVTYADEQLLISDGMFELNAKITAGEEVFINQDSPLKLVAAVDEAMPEIKLFKGNSQKGKVNWTSPENQSNSPIIIPFEILDGIEDSLKHSVECRSYINCFLWSECKGNIDNCSLDLLHYQNTFVATKEFWDRYIYIRYFGLDYRVQKPMLEWKNTANLNLLELYTSMDIWKVDSMILDELIKHKDILSIDIGNGNGYLKAIDKCTKFKDQKITQVDPRFFIDIDTAALKKFEQTFRDGFEFDKLRYQSYQYLTSLLEKVTFDFSSFGWYNLDRFLSDPSAQPTEIKVALQADDLLAFNLVLKDYRTIITPSNKNGNSFAFSGMLPQVPAYLIAISEQDGQLLLAKKEILIGENKEEQLELKSVTVEELEEALEAIEEGYKN